MHRTPAPRCWRRFVKQRARSSFSTSSLPPKPSGVSRLRSTVTPLASRDCHARRRARARPRRRHRRTGRCAALRPLRMSTVSPSAPPTPRAPSDGAPSGLLLNAEVIACGVQPAIEVAPGTATAIATGGVIPRGADAVVMIEQTELIENAAAPAIDVRRAVAAGAIRRPCRLRHRARRDAAAQGHAHRLARDRHAGGLRACRGRVVRRPRVAVLSTGDELVAPGAAAAARRRL